MGGFEVFNLLIYALKRGLVYQIVKKPLILYQH